MKKEIFLEDILDQILNNKGTLAANIQQLRNLIEYQRSFESHELEDILKKLNLSGKTNQSSISTNGLPYPVAHLVEAVNNQQNTLVKVLFLCDAVECFIRWRLSEMLTLLHNTKKDIPDQALGKLPESIAKPSMGSWRAGFYHLASQIDSKIAKAWGVDSKNLQKDSQAMKQIIELRNKLSHGDIAGNAQGYWGQIHPLAKAIFDRYRRLNISHLVYFNEEYYTATGSNFPEKTSATYPKVAHTITKSTNQYQIQHQNQTYQIPLLFLVHPYSTDHRPFRTLSFITTKKKVNTPTGGGSLEYTIIDDEGIKAFKEVELLTEFIDIFKLQKNIQSTQYWLGLLNEVTEADAWDMDQMLLTHRLKSNEITSSTNIAYANPNSEGKITEVEKKQCIDETLKIIETKITDCPLWYIGGQAQSSKSTLLFSWARRRNQKDTVICPHRFSKISPEENLTQFFQSLQDVLTYWLQQEISLPNADASLTGSTLIDNVTDLLERFCALPQKPKLIIALDDLHLLCDPSTIEQPHLESLLNTIASWKRFTANFVHTNYDQTKQQQTYQGHCIKQVFCLATGLDISMGPNADTLTDIDVLLNNHPHVRFVYDLTTLPCSSNPPLDVDQSFEYVDFFQELSPVQRERWHEVVQHYHTDTGPNNPHGAHIPPIGPYGTKKLLLGKVLDPQLVQILQIQRGKMYINKIIQKAQGNPAVISSIGENLRNGHITIDDPLTDAICETIIPSVNNPYLQDISRLIPLLVTFLNHPIFTEDGPISNVHKSDEQKKIRLPLTVTSLEILCSNTSKPTFENERFILEALYSIPKLVKHVTLKESNQHGELASGWVLRENIDPDQIFKEDVLSLTKQMVDTRIELLQQALPSMDDSLQLKELLLSHTSIQSNEFEDIYRPLRGKLKDGIRAILQKNPNNLVLKQASSMLYQTYAIANPQLTWLQKADESKRYSTYAQQFINKDTFKTVWLRHVNTAHLPVLNHELTSIGYTENIKETHIINEDFYLVLGGKSSNKGQAKYTSLSLLHTQRSLIEMEFLSPTNTDTIADYAVHHCSSNKVAIVYNIGSTIHVHLVQLGLRAKEIAHHTFDHQENVIQILSSTDSVVVFGERNDGKHCEFDIITNLHDTPSCSSHSTSIGKGKKPKFAFIFDDSLYCTFDKALFCLDASNTLMPVTTLQATPKLEPLKTRRGLLFIGGGSKKTRNHTWYCPTTKTTCSFADGQNNTKFHEIIGIFDLPNDRVLTVDYKGGLRIYAPENTDNTLLIELAVELPTEVQKGDQGLKGGLLQDNRLLLYGVKSFMAFFDIDTLLNNLDDSSKLPSVYPPSVTLNKHYGTIVGAQHLSSSYQGHSDVFLTFSEDNDVRAWSFRGDTENGHCIGLFRNLNDKVKCMSILNNLLIGADNKHNLQTWHINNGAAAQLKAFPDRNASYMQGAFWYKDNAWIVATEKTDVFIYSSPKDGSTWSTLSALRSQTSPVFQHYKGSIKVIQLDKQLLLTINDRLHCFDLDTQTARPIVLDNEQKGLKIEYMKRFDKGVVAYSKQDIYLLEDTSKGIQPRLVHTVSDDRFITAIHCVPSEGVAESIHFAVTLDNPKDGGKVTREVYALDLTNNTLQSVAQIQSTAQICQVWHHQGDTIFGIENSNGFQYFLHRASLNKVFECPSHSLLKTKLKSIYRLPNNDGYAFRSGDDARRWTLVYDYIYEETGRSAEKVWQLKHTDCWSYASAHLPEMVKAFSGKPTVLSLEVPTDTHESPAPHIDIMAEEIPQGIVLHYKSSNMLEGKRLLWTGRNIRGFSLSHVLKRGRILLQKNRELIVLQLMQGDDEISFLRSCNTERTREQGNKRTKVHTQG